MQENHSVRLGAKCRRGMLELDLILRRFVDRAYPDLSQAEQRLFFDLLEEEDPTLQSWFTRVAQPEGPERRTLVDQIIAVASGTDSRA
jgi:antitoxin CptB